MKNGLVLLLTAVGGYVDGVSYLALGRVFTVNMTGNTVLLGLSLVQGDAAGAGRSALALGGFLVGGALGALLVERDRQPAVWPRGVTLALSVEAVLLGVLAVVHTVTVAGATRLLGGVEELVPDGSVKLGFRAHYPQLETKLTVRGRDRDDARAKLAPVEAEVRKRLGNFILAEDDQTLEGVVLAELASRPATLTIVETFTGGQVAARLAHLPGAEKAFRRGIVARDLSEVAAAVALDATPTEITRETAEAVAQAARRATGATHALAVLIDLDDGPDRIEFGGTICLAIATGAPAATYSSGLPSSTGYQDRE